MDKAKDAPAGEEVPFEGLLDELEAVVERLERGEQTLDEALGDFERGMALATRAGSLLDQAEARVDKLLEARDGTLREVPLDEP